MSHRRRRAIAGGADLPAAVIPETDIWAAALLMVKRYKADAMLAAAARADDLLEAGNWQGAATWHRMLDCVERLQSTKPAGGELCVRRAPARRCGRRRRQER